MTYEECMTEYWAQAYCSQFEFEATVSEKSPDFFAVLFSYWPLISAIIIVIILAVITATVIQQKQVGIVERLGRYNRSLQAGFHLIIPFIEKVVQYVDLEQFQLRVNSDIKTKDDQMVTLPVAVIFKVIPEQAEVSHYEVDRPEDAMKALISNEVKAKAATMTLEDIYTDRDSIKTAVIAAVGETIMSYGFVVLQVVIDNPKLPKELQEAYNSVAIAEKNKQAAAAQGEALKIELVAKATANGASLAIQGDAYVLNRDKIAKGNAEAIKTMIGDTNLTPGEAVGLLVAIDANDAVRDASSNKGTTVVVATGNSNDRTLGMIAGQG